MQQPQHNGDKPLDKRPVFLKRTLLRNGVMDAQLQTELVLQSGLECKICPNTYKMFFVDGTEDLVWRRTRRYSDSEVVAARAKLTAKYLASVDSRSTT